MSLSIFENEFSPVTKSKNCEHEFSPVTKSKNTGKYFGYG
jgi:hypothetical protein